MAWDLSHSCRVLPITGSRSPWSQSQLRYIINFIIRDRQTHQFLHNAEVKGGADTQREPATSGNHLTWMVVVRQ